MLQVEEALLSFNMSCYGDAIRSLTNVERYLNQEQTEHINTWRIARISSIRQHLQDYAQHRSIALDNVGKKKNWVVRPSIVAGKIVL